MTQTQELIEEVRKKLDGATDYKVAQALDIPRQYVSRYMSGDAADSYTCARIAEVLERDPLEVIAQVEAEAARTEKKRAYWRSFFSGLKHKAHVIALSATCGFLGGGWPDGNAEANLRLTSRNVYYVKYYAIHARHSLQVQVTWAEKSSSSVSRPTFT